MGISSPYTVSGGISSLAMIIKPPIRKICNVYRRGFEVKNMMSGEAVWASGSHCGKRPLGHLSRIAGRSRVGISFALREEAAWASGSHCCGPRWSGDATGFGSNHSSVVSASISRNRHYDIASAASKDPYGESRTVATTNR